MRSSSWLLHATSDRLSSGVVPLHVLLSLRRREGIRLRLEPASAQPGGGPAWSMSGDESVHVEDRFSAGHAGEAESHGAEPEVNEASAERRGVVIMALGE